MKFLPKEFYNFNLLVYFKLTWNDNIKELPNSKGGATSAQVDVRHCNGLNQEVNTIKSGCKCGQRCESSFHGKCMQASCFMQPPHM
jgi:hypothetical protein